MFPEIASSGQLITFAAHFIQSGGHDQIYHQCLQKAFAELGGQAKTYIPSTCPLNLNSSQWVKHFRMPMNSFQTFYYRFGDFLQIFKQTSKSTRTIHFLESFTFIEFLAFVLAMLAGTSPHQHIWLLFRDAYTKSSLLKKTAYLSVFYLLRFSQKKRLRLFSDSAPAARELATFLKYPVSVLPIPHTECPSISRPLSQIAINLWFPGAPRQEKGTKHITTISNRLQSTNLDLHLWTCHFSDLKAGSKIHFVSDNLTRQEYLSHFAKMDIILLPYDPQKYAYRTSGIFVEAIIAGKMPVAAANSWLASELTKHNLNELIVNFESCDIVEQLHRLYSNPIIREKLSKMQKAYMAFHNQEKFTAALGSHL